MKQVILVRKDLKLPPGKLAVQVAHAAIEAAYASSPELVEKWRATGAKKVVLYVADITELIAFKKKCANADLVTAKITDAGKTFFKKPTITCVGVGPDDEEKIDAITGELKMV